METDILNFSRHQNTQPVQQKDTGSKQPIHKAKTTRGTDRFKSPQPLKRTTFQTAAL